MYEKERELARLSIQSWTSKEVFSLGWFLIVGILIVFYAVWLKLVDRSRGTGLMLIGSLEAVAKTLIVIFLGNELGLFHYNIRLLPINTTIFATSITVSPIMVMLVQQYTSSWKSFLFWDAICFAFINFIIFPIYMAVGVLEFHHWNVFYHFLILYPVSCAVRVIFLWITGTQKKLIKAAE